jgi:hypothetical protein
MDAKTFHQDVHHLSDGFPLWGKYDFMMANPPFNVDMVDEYKMMSNRLQPTSRKVRGLAVPWDYGCLALGHDGWHAETSAQGIGWKILG